MLKILTHIEKKEILNRLTVLLQNFKTQQNTEMWWHSQRMSYSLKQELIPQTVYVDKYPNFNYIISSYTHRQKGMNFEVYTTSPENSMVNKEATDQTVSMIASDDMPYGQLHAAPYYLYPLFIKSLQPYKVNLFEEVYCHGMTFPWEKINKLMKDIHPIDGFICKPLTERDVELVNQRYKYGNHQDAYEWIKKSILTLPSMGCWKEDGELIGQFIIMETGNIGGLYVIDEYKGLKLGKWIVKEMTKSLHDINFPMVLETDFQNTLSYALFTGLGFETVARSYYSLLSKYPEITVPN